LLRMARAAAPVGYPQRGRGDLTEKYKKNIIFSFLQKPLSDGGYESI
jgi:hypothetical protein